MPYRKITFPIASVVVAVLAMPLVSVPAAAGDISNVAMIANTCAVCHGTDGKGALKIPKLKGELEVKDFVQTMKGFKSGDEKSTVMARIAEGYTEEQYQMLAEYFANLK